MSHVVPKKFQDISVENWLNSYKDLLDQWRLWEERALLDISLTPFRHLKKSPVVVRCHFCNQSIVPGTISKGMRGTKFARYPAGNQKKVCNCEILLLTFIAYKMSTLSKTVTKMCCVLVAIWLFSLFHWR